MKAMQKGVIILIILSGFLSFCGVQASASQSETEQIIAHGAGLSELENEYITSEELSGEKDINILDKILSALTLGIKNGFLSGLKAFSMICGVVILSAVMTSLKWTSTNPSLHLAYEFVSVLALSGVTFAIFTQLFELVSAALNSVADFFTALLPVTASLYTIGGNTSAALTSGSLMMLFLTAMNRISADYLMPLLQISFALCLSSAIPGSVNISSVNSFVKNALTITLSFVYTIFGFVLYIQTSVSAAADNLAYRSVKFASGVFVPVIGSIVGDASRTVAGSLGVIKALTGTVGIVVVIMILLPAIIYIVMHKLAVLASAIIAKTLGCERESAFLYDLNGIMNILVAICIGTSVVLIIAMAVFIKTTVTL